MVSISVIVPTLGRKEEVKNTLENISDQTFRDFEVIIVDDNPIDSEEREFISKTIKNHNQELKITHLKRDSKKGLASARNEGIETSEGDYIAFLDDDDAWKDEKLQKQIENLKNSEYDACFTSRTIRTPYESNHIVNAESNVNELSEILKENLIGSPSSVIVRKDKLELVGGFDEKMDGAEEWDLWTRLVDNGCWFKAIKEPLTVYTEGNDSMASHSDIITPGREKFTKKYREKIEKNSTTASQHYLTRGIEQFEFKNFEKSRKYLLTSIKFNKKTSKAYIFLLGIIIEDYTGLEIIDSLVKLKHRFE